MNMRICIWKNTMNEMKIVFQSKNVWMWRPVTGKYAVGGAKKEGKRVNQVVEYLRQHQKRKFWYWGVDDTERQSSLFIKTKQ